MRPQRIAGVLAVLGGLAVAAGIGWVYPPAGVIAAGVEGLAGAYLVAYFGSRRRGAIPRRPRS